MQRKSIYFPLLLLLALVSLLWTSSAVAQAPDGEEYVIQADDWLSKLAEKTYGDMFAYPSIVEATNAKAAEDDSFAAIDNPDIIEIGQKIWLPATIEGSEEMVSEESSEEMMSEEGSEEMASEEEAATEGEMVEPVFEEFDSGNFADSTTIDNNWLPLQPGTQWAYEGTTTEDDETTAHRIEFTVTDLTKEIEGINTVVAWVLDYSDDELVEAELAFYAQDNDGNVWYMGEYPEEYEEGEFVAAPTWIAGLEEAKAGIMMMADPQLETPRYFEGWGPAVEWTDFGQVEQMGQEDCVPVDCYEDVLVIAESSLDEIEMDTFQLKYYAPGVGNIRVGWRGEDATQEELELVEFTQLDPEALADIREEALALEAHAYEVSENVYGQTAPAEAP